MIHFLIFRSFLLSLVASSFLVFSRTELHGSGDLLYPNPFLPAIPFFQFSCIRSFVFEIKSCLLSSLSLHSVEANVLDHKLHLHVS